jgi:hypothetical protein
MQFGSDERKCLINEKQKVSEDETSTTGLREPLCQKDLFITIGKVVSIVYTKLFSWLPINGFMHFLVFNGAKPGLLLQRY